MFSFASKGAGFSPILQYVGGAQASRTTAGNLTISLTSLTGGIGTQPIEGDLVLIAGAYVSTTDGNPSISGYTEIADLYADGTADVNFGAYYKVMTASPDTSAVFTNTSTDDSSAVAHVWRNVNATPLDVTTTTATGTGTGRPDPAAITPITPEAVVVILAAGANSSDTETLVAPSGYSNQVSVASFAGSAGISVIAASKYWSSGEENPGQCTGGSTDAAATWAAATVAIRPK
jgi:hypothetical protein